MIVSLEMLFDSLNDVEKERLMDVGMNGTFIGILQKAVAEYEEQMNELDPLAEGGDAELFQKMYMDLKCKRDVMRDMYLFVSEIRKWTDERFGGQETGVDEDVQDS